LGKIAAWVLPFKRPPLLNELVSSYLELISSFWRAQGFFGDF